MIERLGQGTDGVAGDEKSVSGGTAASPAGVVPPSAGNGLRNDRSRVRV